MAGVQIVLIFSFLYFFILTRVVWVRIIKKEVLKIEIHLPLLAIHLIFPKNKRSTSKKSEKISARAYIRIISETIKRVWDCRIEIKEVALPCKTDLFNGLTLVRPFGYQGLIYAVIAYMKTKAKDLTLNDNAIISSPDVTEVQYYVTVKLRLFKLIYAILTFMRGVYQEKRSRRIKYVGE